MEPQQGIPSLALRLAGLLSKFWEIRSRYAEGLESLEAALEAAGPHAQVGDRARARRAHAELHTSTGSTYDWQGSMEESRALAADALALSRQAGHPAGIAEALLLMGGLDAAESLPQPRRRALAEEALEVAREAGDERMVAFALKERALSVPPEEGATELEEAIAVLRKVGRRAGTRVPVLQRRVQRDQARPARARAADVGQRGRRSPASSGHAPTLAFLCGNVGMEALFANDLDRARGAFDEQLELCREHVLWVAAEGLSGLAAIAARQGDPERAAHLLGAASATGPWDGDADVARHLEEHFFAAAREQLGTAHWNEAHGEGQAR